MPDRPSGPPAAAFDDGVSADAVTVPAPALADPNVAAAPVTGTEYGPPTPARPDVLDRDSPAPPAPGRWTVGSLSYTTAGLLVLFAVLLGGDFALSMRERAVGPIVQDMVKRMTTQDVLLAVLLSTLPTAITLLVLPVVSYRSDRHRGRWGRRIPFLLVPTPLAAGAMVLLAFSEDFGRMLHNAVDGTAAGVSAQAFSLMCFALLWTAFECAALVAVPMFGALINDVVPRPVLGRFFGMFRAVSLIAGILFNQMILKYAAVHYRLILVSIAAAFLVGVTAMCVCVREGQYPPPAPEPAGRQWWSVWTRSFGYVRACFTIPYYRWVFAAFTLAGLSFQPVNLFSQPYAKSLGIDLGQFGHLSAIMYTISLCLAWPLGWLVDKAHALRVSVCMMALYAASTIAAGLLVRDAATFSFFFVTHGVLSGCYFTTSASLGQVLFPRITYARYAAGATVVAAVATLGFGPGIGWLLDFSDHAYVLTYWIGFAISTAALAVLVVVQVLFNRLGGRGGYAAPEAAAVA